MLRTAFLLSCFQEGYGHAITKKAAEKEAATKSAGIKSAISPRFAGIHIDPSRFHQMAELGENTFRKSYQASSPFSGLFHAMLPGYDQLASAHRLRNRYFQDMADLKPMFRGIPPHSGAHEDLVDRVRALTDVFRHNKQQQFAELGSVVEPRLNTLRHAGYGAAGAGGAAVGAGLGNLYGRQQGHESTVDRMESMPLMERLKFLISPNAVTHPSHAPTAAPETPYTV